MLYKKINDSLISIIIPIFNSEKTIKKCIESILNQSYKNFELLLIDNGSTDNTLNIIKQYMIKNKKIKLLKEVKRGRGPARYKGEINSKGKIILMTDSDCILPENWIIEMSKPILNYECDGIQGSEISGKNDFWNININKIMNHKRFKFTLGNIDTKNFAIRKSILQKIGYTSRKYISGNDTDLSIRLYKDGIKIKYIKKIKVKHIYPSKTFMIIKKQIIRAKWCTIITNDNKKYLKKTQFFNDTNQTFFSFIKIFPGLIITLFNRGLNKMYVDMIYGLSWRVGLMQGWISIYYNHFNNMIKTGFQEVIKGFYLRLLIFNENNSKIKIQKIQLKKLKKLLLNTYKNNQLYREKYKKAGISLRTIKDIKKLDQISIFPIITKDEIKNIPMSKALSKGYCLNDCSIASTSGSTGKPLEFAVSRRYQAFRDATHEYVLRTIGCRRTQRAMFLKTPKDNNHEKIIKKKNRYEMSPYACLNTKINAINRIKPNFIIANPIMFFEMAEGFEKEKYRIQYKLKGIICTGEMLTEHIKSRIKKIFDTEIFNCYGSSEVADIAIDCRYHNGMHEISQHAYIEIINKSRDIIVTDLDNYAMPFIRYKMEDIGLILKKRCMCGKNSLIIKAIDGRIQNFIISKDDNKISPLVFTGKNSPLNKYPNSEIIKQYQIIQENDKSFIIQ
jgi:phenylacetate-CoA ligase